MAIDHRQVHFRDKDRSEVIAELTRIADRRDRVEWVTISPWVDPEHVPVTSVLRRLFSGRGSKVPEVTWVPAEGDEPAELGVIHATGPDALDRALQAGVDVPERWIKLGDHAKRGLLFAVDPSTSHEELLDVAIGLARALAEVPTDDRWITQVSSVR